MSSEQPRVLVVEDNALDRALLQAHLQRLPAELEFAGDGVEALEMLDRDSARFDVILLDRTMPRMNGLEVLARLKADPRCRTIPVILQTGCVGREEMVEGIKAGAYYYLTKPYNADVLRMVVQTAVADNGEIRRLQSQLERGSKAILLAQSAVFTLRTIDDARDLGAVLARACPDPEAAVIGLTEILVNAVEHGNLGITYDEKSQLRAQSMWEAEVQRRLSMPEYADRAAEVRFERVDGEVRFTVRDCGDGFEWQRYFEIDPARAFDTHGRGILMARHFSFHSLEYRGCGNEVVAIILANA
ncbi:MAG TPA: response regulator [Thermoanaerobaculia bacterium]|nr:response regulator [Thermoanaerobaculia bacterium]